MSKNTSVVAATATDTDTDRAAECADQPPAGPLNVGAHLMPNNHRPKLLVERHARAELTKPRQLAALSQ